MTGTFDRALPLAMLLAATTIAAGSAACSSQSGGATQPKADGAADALPADASSVLDSVSPEASDAVAETSADATSIDATTGADGGTDAGEGGADSGCALGGFNEPLDLACTGLYSDFASKTVSADVTQYDPGLHLWSDGAVKTRWIYLPPGADGGRMPIDTSNMDEWNFPVGTKFWKEFVLGGKRIETRLLTKISAPNTWYRTTYHWSADETSAPELTDGLLNADGNGYQIPNQQDCDTCHGGRQDGVLGFEAVSLASANATPMTVASLATSGWITDVPDASLAIPGNAVDVAALGYLHANCGIPCHNANIGAAARNTGFHMRLDVATLATVQTTDTWTTGVNQMTRAFQIPGETTTFRLAPGDAGASCVFYRMSHRDGLDDVMNQTQMPPLDTHKVDDAGVATIGAWIAQGCQ